MRANNVLADRKIDLKSNRLGTHRVPCPECDRGRADTALAVTVRPDGSAVWLCHRCGWKGGAGGRDRYAAMRQFQAPIAPKQPAPVEGGLSDYGQRILAECRPIEPGGPVHTYLTGRRCALPETHVWEHPRLWHAPSRTSWPAMVSLVTDVVTGAPISLHRTYVDPGGGKARVQPPRLLLKDHRKAGGVVRLVEDAEVEMGLVIGEGIETCLSAMAAGLSPAWACIDAGNMAAFPVLPGIEALTVLVDHDANGRGQQALAAVARRWLQAGREVRRILPSQVGTDVNDIVREVDHAA